MEVKFKRLHPKAVLPAYAKPGDAAMDLTVTEVNVGVSRVTYKFGLAVEIPEGHVGLIFPRSSVHKKLHALSNAVGVIDSGYRGEIQAVFYLQINEHPYLYKQGERAAQLIIMPYPEIEPVWSAKLSTTERGGGGYGSTGE